MSSLLVIKRTKPVFLVDGGWSDWSPWSLCHPRCGPGFTHRIRECNRPEQKGAGRHCVGDRQLTEQCKLRECNEPGNVPSEVEYLHISATMIFEKKLMREK